MQPVAYHRLAAAELIESARFYDQRRIGLGDEFLSAVDGVLELIRAQPELGRRGPLGTLSLRTRRFPFRVVYELQADRIWVVAVAHLSRRPSYWAGRLE
ncbi:MAG: type II toxin-antitoxin system RelE/ParE family toxin [Verrucomicrobiales bacterium]|nr:type II toxin-antitoxin system RelE/ParE family toxin [Verrucomicrobiales bacterium]